MRVLITGGAGFIGSHLADRLLAEGHTVRVLDSLDPQVHGEGGPPGYLDPEVELQVDDVRDHAAVGRAREGVDAPWLRPDEQLARREWDVLADDGTPLEPEPTAEGKPLRPTSIYAITKRDHEEMALVTGAAYGIPTVALRFFNVYGERQALSNPYTGVVAIFASRLLNGRPPLVFEDGRQQRDFVDVRDIARGCALALTHDGADGQTVNLGTGRPTSVLDVSEALSSSLGVDVEPEIVSEYRAGDVRHCYADTRRAGELLGFGAEIDFDRGMRDLLEWLQDQEAVDAVDAAREELAARGLTR